MHTTGKRTSSEVWKGSCERKRVLERLKSREWTDLASIFDLSENTWIHPWTTDMNLLI
jgi:hypothetical protein